MSFLSFPVFRRYLMQMDERGGRKAPLVPHAFSRELNEFARELGAGDVLAYRHAAGTIIAMPSAIERPRQ